MTVQCVYVVLGIALVSLIFPAWIVSRESKPTHIFRGITHPFQWWFLCGCMWLLLSLFLHIFLMVGRITNDGYLCFTNIKNIYERIVYCGWPLNWVIGGIVWQTIDKKSLYKYISFACAIFNACFIVFLCKPYSIVVVSMMALVLALLWVVCCWFSYKKLQENITISMLFILAGSLCAGIGGGLWFVGRYMHVLVVAAGVALWFSAGIVTVAVGLIFYVINKITGVVIYSNSVALVSLIILCCLAPLAYVFKQGNSLGTIFGVSIGFIGLTVGTNLWMAFETMKQKTIDELAARWVSLGSWLPAGVASDFTAFGGWCLCIGTALCAISSFQVFSVHVTSTLWQEGLIKLILIGGAGSFFLASMYTAWSEKASAPVNRIAAIGYWHFMGSLIVMIVCYLLAGLTSAAQLAAADTLAVRSSVDLIVSAWQRPFLVGIAVTDIMMFASILICTINLIRAQSVSSH